jgi:hypothetical protein
MVEGEEQPFAIGALLLVEQGQGIEQVNLIVDYWGQAVFEPRVTFVALFAEAVDA